MKGASTEVNETKRIHPYRHHTGNGCGKGRAAMPMKQREILIDGKRTFTKEPSDYVIAHHVGGTIWKFLCCNNIMSLDSNYLRPYHIERYTCGQATSVLQFMFQWGQEEHRKFQKVLYSDFIRDTKSKYYVTWFDDTPGRVHWLETVDHVNRKNRVAERKMMAFFVAKKRMKQRGIYSIACRQTK